METDCYQLWINSWITLLVKCINILFLILNLLGHNNDYMTITEHYTSNICILGYKAQYKVTKPSSM